jgi:hypothetical protein
MMRKLFVFVLLGIFLISFASAAEFDNIMDYDESTDTITFENRFGIGLIGGGKVAEAQLLENECIDNRYCHATKTIILEEEMDLIQDFKTLRVDDDSWKEEDIKSYKFEYWGDVLDYEKQCVTDNFLNGSEYQDCSMILSGSHKGWIKFQEGQVFQAGEYLVRTSGEIKYGRTYDWQVKINGDWTTPWAIWGGGFIDNENIYWNYRYDDDMTDETGKYDGTVNSGVAFVDGFYNKSGQYLGVTSDRITIPDDAFNTTIAGSDFTINTMINFTASPPASPRKIISLENGETRIEHDNLGNLEFEIDVGSVEIDLGNFTVNQWHMITAVKNSTGISLYVDGSFIKHTAVTVSPSDTGVNHLGSNGVTASFTGLLDETTLFTEALTQDQITTLYNSSATLQYPYGTGQVTLNSPADNYTAASPEVEFNCSAQLSGGASLVNMSLYNNLTGTFQASNTTIFNVTAEGIVSWWEFEGTSGNVNDSQGNFNGTNVGATRGVSGIIGNAFNFDGNNDYVALNNTVFRTDGGNVSAFAWVRLNDSGAQQVIFGQYTSGIDGRFGLNVHPTSDDLNLFIGGTGGINYGAGPNIIINAWTFVGFTLDENGNARLYVNGSQVGTTQTGVTRSIMDTDTFIGNFNAGQTQWAKGNIDEASVWNKTLSDTEILDLYNSGSGKRPGVTSSTQAWNLSINGTVSWNCQACDSDGDCGFATDNRTVELDISEPIISIESPNGTLDYGSIGGNETLNVTFTDTSLDTCWYDYNGTNVTISNCVSAIKNSTNFILEEDNLNLTVYANDTIGNTGSSFVSWNYDLLETSQTFNNITTEGATETFSINITKSSDLQISTIHLIYNGTSNSFPYIVSDNEVFSESTVTIPTVDSDTNVTFYWSITFSDNSIINTSSNTQAIQPINVDDCSSYTNLLYNFSQLDEENQTSLSGNNTIEVQVNLYDTQKTSVLINFSKEFQNTNPAQVCLEDPILETVNYSSYVVVKYFSNSSLSSEIYSTEYYNILNQTIANSTVPVNIKLYNLRQDDTTKFRLTFRDDEYVLAPNILVQVHRQYIKDNDFKIVEIPLTDSNGQTMLNLVKDTVIYNFIMVNESGDIIGTFNSITAFCQDFTIGDCTINLAPDSPSEDAYDYNEEFDISISDPIYDNSTSIISMNFVTGDLTSKNVRMEIVRNNDFGNRSVCSDSLFAASGLLSCDVSSITDSDQFLFISTFVEDDLAKQDTTNLNSDILNFGTLNGAFYAFLLILILISLFMEDRKVLVVSLGLGWVGVISLGLINGKLIGFTSAGIWILISIAIFLWKLNSEESI